MHQEISRLQQLLHQITWAGFDSLITVNSSVIGKRQHIPVASFLGVLTTGLKTVSRPIRCLLPTNCRRFALFIAFAELSHRELGLCIDIPLHRHLIICPIYRALRQNEDGYNIEDSGPGEDRTFKPLKKNQLGFFSHHSHVRSREGSSDGF